MSEQNETTKFSQIKQTKGTFEVRGRLFGMKSEKAFKEMTNSANNLQRMMHLGVRISETENLYLDLNASVQKTVWVSKQVKKGEKSQTKEIDWDKRNRFNEDGWRIIGMGLALHKNEETTKNEEVKVFTPFDAIKEIEDNATDGMSVFVKGTIEFGSYEDTTSKEIRKTQKFIPNAIYLTASDIDFTVEKKMADFAQPVIFNAVRREKQDGSDVVKYFLDVAYIGYKSYEEFSLQCTDVVANTFKEKVKPFTGITLVGHVESDQVVETVEVEVDGDWGEKINVGKPKGFAKVNLFVTGGRPETIDKENYTKKIVDSYRDEVEKEKTTKRNKTAGAATQDGDWGNKSGVKEDSAW